MMFRLGAVLIVLGFGSAALHFSEVQFRALVWAEPAQPVLGLLLGVGGVAIVAAGAASNRTKRASARPHTPVPRPGHGQPSQNTSGPGYGPPPGQPQPPYGGGRPPRNYRA